MNTKQFQVCLLSVIFSMLTMHSLAQGDSTKVQVQANYHNRDCLGGAGFCDGTNQITKNASGSTEVNKLSDHVVMFIVPASDFTTAQFFALFGANQVDVDPNGTYEFDQNEEIELDTDILTQLEIDLSYKVIRDGFYTMVLDSGNIKITFMLSQ